MRDQKLDAFIQAAKDCPWADPRFYATWMAQVHYFTSHSVQMLKDSAEYTKDAEFKRHLTAHIKEETGHDKIALHDMKVLGFALEQLPEFGVTRAMWEAQLYKCRTCPQALLGYIYALEKAAVELYEYILPIITKAHGKDAVKFVALHAAEDIAHVAQQRAQIDSLPEFEKREALTNSEHTAEMLQHLISDVMQFSMNLKATPGV